jgi:hypothetical protein
MGSSINQILSLNITLEAFSLIKEKLDICTDYKGPSLFLTVESIWKGYNELKSRGVKLRFIAEITKDNIAFCKELMKVAEMRHLDGIKGSNFGIADEKDYRASANTQARQPLTIVVITTVKAFVEQQQYFFETLWNKAIPAYEKIREIEEKAIVVPIGTKIIENQDEIIKEIRNMNNTADKRCCGIRICTVEPQVIYG